MRTITGDIALPANCPKIRGAAVLIEVHDVSRADAPSPLVAQTRLTDVNLQPNGRVAFSLPVPEVADAQSLGVRIHISLSESGHVKRGDLLTTASHPIPSRGSPGRIIVPVTVI